MNRTIEERMELLLPRVKDEALKRALTKKLSVIRRLRGGYFEGYLKKYIEEEGETMKILEVAFSDRMQSSKDFAEGFLRGISQNIPPDLKETITRVVGNL